MVNKIGIPTDVIIIQVLNILRNYPCEILSYPVIVLGRNFFASEYFTMWTIIKEIKVD